VVEGSINKEIHTFEAEIKSLSQHLDKQEANHKKLYGKPQTVAKEYSDDWDQRSKFIFRRDLDRAFALNHVCMEMYKTHKGCKISLKHTWMDDRGEKYRNKFVEELKSLTTSEVAK
jgi:predicted RNase H-like nuclease (RuvC/YqgF family)